MGCLCFSLPVISPSRIVAPCRSPRYHLFLLGIRQSVFLRWLHHPRRKRQVGGLPVGQVVVVGVFGIDVVSGSTRKKCRRRPQAGGMGLYKRVEGTLKAVYNGRVGHLQFAGR